MSDPADVCEVVDPAQLDRQVCFVLTLAAHSVVAIYRSLLDPMHAKAEFDRLTGLLRAAAAKPARDLAHFRGALP